MKRQECGQKERKQKEKEEDGCQTGTWTEELRSRALGSGRF
jgi:hypothetical protein